MSSEKPAGMTPAEKRAALARLLQNKQNAPVVAPLSFAQQRMWLLAQIRPDDASYNVFQALRFTGTLDRTALQRSFAEIVRRHETLRTTFSTVDGQPRQ